MERATLFRSPPFTVGRITGPPGVLCEWALDLVPLGDRTVVPGQRVELHARVAASAGEVAESPAVAFDVLPADTAGEPAGAPLVRLLGTGAGGAGGVRSEARITVERELGAGEDPAAARSAFVAERQGDLSAQLLILREAEATHAITWWPVDAGGAPALHFSVDIEGLTSAARTQRALRLGPAPAGARALRFELRSEDDAPMADAVLEIAFEGGLRTRATTGADGRAAAELPPGASEVFRIFLVSYVEGRGAPGPQPPAPPPPQPPPRPGEPEPPVVPAQADTRPEVVAAFAFDSAFPAPAVHAALLRVRDKAEAAADDRLIVLGHTDQVGTDAYNLSLSERRAQAVLALLLDDKDMFDAVAAAEGWDLRAHQAMLRGVGCNPGAIDGNAGPLTRVATTNFQREYNLGVYHQRAYVERDRPTLAVDGNPGPATRAAIRDAYVAVAPHVLSLQVADPQFEGCGEAHPISAGDPENRRAVVAFLAPDVDLSQSTACSRYEELIGETPEDRRVPHFSDHQWLQEEDGALHLSSATVVADGTPARIRVMRCEGPVPAPLPDSSGGGAAPVVGPTLAELEAEIRGGICAGRWRSPDPDVMNSDTWIIDRDIEIEIHEPADHAAPADDDPASSTSLMDSDALHPPVYVVEAGDAWGLAGPPGQRLNRVRFGDEVADDGVAVQSDGSVLPFGQQSGLVEAPEAVDVLSLAVSEREVELR